jgi:hypothetical protein
MKKMAHYLNKIASLFSRCVLPSEQYTPEQKVYYTILMHGSQTSTQLIPRTGIFDNEKRLEIITSLLEEGLIRLVAGQGERAEDQNYASYEVCP